MKNPITTELRRIRDAHAKKCNYDFDILATDWMSLDRWEKTKAVKLQGKRIVRAFPRLKATVHRSDRKRTGTRMNMAARHGFEP